MNAPQGSEAWMLARCGYATASQFSSVLAKGQGKTRTAYLRRVLAERLTGKPMDTYRNADMERGNEQEPLARDLYEEQRGCIVMPSEFIALPDMMAGCSPDGLIEDDGGIEIKSVLPTVQLETILAGEYPSEHKAQIHGSMWITGRKWWDFVSFSPDMPEHLRLYVFRVFPDDAYIRNLQAEVTVFLREVDAFYNKLMNGEFN